MNPVDDDYHPRRFSKWLLLTAWIVFFVPSMAISLHWHEGAWAWVWSIGFGVIIATSMTLGALYAVFVSKWRDR